MNYRINTKVVAVVALLILVAGGMFVYTLVSSPGREEAVQTEKPQQTAPEQIITARHQFKDGIHTIAGSAVVPTTCHRIIATPFLLDSGATVEIQYTTLMEGPECPNQETNAPFTVTFAAVENAVIRATWNGVPVTLNLVPLGPGESLDDTLYIKG